MLPDPNDSPTGRLQPLISICISGLIGLDLVTPEVSIALWPRGVFWASVPKTSVHEYRQALLGEDDVGCSPWLCEDSEVQSIAKTLCMQSATKVQFRARAFLSDAR